MTDDIPAGAIAGLIGLLLLSAFFSGTETALMTLNRYRLRHRARQGHRGARLAERLLERPDRLISLILLGSNVANALATSLVTVVAIRVGGAAGAAVAGLGIGFVIMIFTDIMPKTLGALQSERVAYPAAYIYFALVKIALPIVWLVTFISNSLLRLIGVRTDRAVQQQVTLEELRTIVAEAGGLLPRRRKQMLMAILELEDMTVDEVMVPDNELVGIDLTDNPADIRQALLDQPHSRLPVYRGNIEALVGLLPARRLIAAQSGTIDLATIESLVEEPFFVPEGTSLHNLLGEFRRSGKRTAFVVDEYGDIQGMITIEDIVEAILGEFSNASVEASGDVRRDDKSDAWIVDAGASIRALNRLMGWSLPTDGPTTLNGLVIEQLETIPRQGESVVLNGYRVEVLETSGSAIRTLRIAPPAAAKIVPAGLR